MKLLHKGDFSKADVPALAANRDLIVTDGVGSGTFSALAAAKATVGVYVKASGVRPTDAQWADAQPYLWVDKGKLVQHMDQKWCYGDVQAHPVEWARIVAIPYVKAALALAPPGLVTKLFVDNTTWQDPSLFYGGPPSNWNAQAYHDGTFAVVRELKRAFGFDVIVNGWCGGAPVGLRGEAIASNADVWAAYFEGFYFKAGSSKLNTHFLPDQAGLVTLLNVGKTVFVEEPGVVKYSREWWQAHGIAISSAGASQHPENLFFNLSGPPWEGWWRG